MRGKIEAPEKRQDLEGGTSEFEEPLHENSRLFSVIVKHDARATAEDEVVENRRGIGEEFAISRIEGVSGAVGRQLVLTSFSFDGSGQTSDPSVHHEMFASDRTIEFVEDTSGRPCHCTVSREEKGRSCDILDEMIQVAFFGEDEHDQVDGKVKFYGLDKVFGEVDHFVLDAGLTRVSDVARVHGLLPERFELGASAHALRVEEAKISLVELFGVTNPNGQHLHSAEAHDNGRAKGNVGQIAANGANETPKQNERRVIDGGVNKHSSTSTDKTSDHHVKATDERLKVVLLSINLLPRQKSDQTVHQTHHSNKHTDTKRSTGIRFQLATTNETIQSHRHPVH